MKKVISLFKTIFYIFLVLIVFINLMTIFTSTVLKQDYPNYFGYTYFEIASNSMYPKLKKGDVVIIKLDCDTYKVGDIITFKDENMYTTHRLKLKDNNQYITKGDANNTEDNPISSSSIVGKVIFKITGLGTMISIMKEPIIIVILCLLVGCMFCIKKKEQ